MKKYVVIRDMSAGNESVGERMKFEIKNIFPGDWIFSVEAESLAVAVELAIKSKVEKGSEE